MSATLTSNQRAYLKGLAHPRKPLVQVGQSGVSDTVVVQVEEALSFHELIKVRLAQPENKKAMADELATRTQAHLVALIGHTVILYKARSEDPVIKLPAPRAVPE